MRLKERSGGCRVHTPCYVRYRHEALRQVVRVKPTKLGCQMFSRYSNPNEAHFSWYQNLQMRPLALWTGALSTSEATHAVSASRTTGVNTGLIGYTRTNVCVLPSPSTCIARHTNTAA